MTADKSALEGALKARRVVLVSVAACILVSACATGHDYACDKREVSAGTPSTGTYPVTRYSFCPCPEEKPCPELDIRNQDKPVLIIRRVPPPGDD